MSANPSQPALTRAIAHVTAAVAERGETEGSRLPPLRLLAHDAGVSILTMWKAVRKLGGQGIVAVRHGSGIFRGPSLPKKPPSDNPRTPKWQSLRSRMMREIAYGNLHNREFIPSFKELSRGYGCAYRPLRRALGELERDGILTPHKRTYRIRRFCASHATISIVFMYDKGIETRYEWRGYRHRIDEFIRVLETECVTRNIRLETRTIDNGIIDLRPLRSTDAQGLLVWGAGGAPLVSHCDALLPEFQRFGRPIVLFDDIGGMEIPEAFAGIKNLYRAVVDDFEAGRQVAGFLLDSGHRHAAFFSNHHDAEWSRNRLGGMQSIYAMLDSASASCTAYVDSFFAARTSLRAYPFKAQTRALNAISEAAVKTLTSGFDRQRVYLVTQELRQYYEMRFAMNSLLKQAMVRPEISAWVCADDDIAVHAVLPFLARHRIKVPNKVSVLSFNNSVEIAWQAGVSSYDFALSKLALRIIDVLLNPESHDPKVLLESKGMVVERGTTGKPDPAGRMRSMGGANAAPARFGRTP
jgi:DNA-binding transcriptional regulator YhcF (GntR family)/DNA-binding LacI/PurR family transcriptional regulator